MTIKFSQAPAVVKVRGIGVLSPLLPFEHPVIVAYEPP